MFVFCFKISQSNKNLHIKTCSTSTTMLKAFCPGEKSAFPLLIKITDLA